MPLHIAHQAFQIVTRVGYAHDTERRPLPGVTGLTLRHRNIEAGPQSVLDAAYHLALVLQRTGTLNANLEPEISHHWTQRTAFLAQHPGHRTPEKQEFGSGTRLVP